MAHSLHGCVTDAHHQPFADPPLESVDFNRRPLQSIAEILRVRYEPAGFGQPVWLPILTNNGPPDETSSRQDEAILRFAVRASGCRGRVRARLFRRAIAAVTKISAWLWKAQAVTARFFPRSQTCSARKEVSSRFMGRVEI